MEVVIVIPCRMGSSRFPGKPLALLRDKPLIRRVYEGASGCGEATRVVVATDDSDIEKAVRSFGGEVVRTGSGCRTGTDRVAEAAESVKADAYVNLQADELITDPGILDDLIRRFRDSPACCIGTFKQAVRDPEELRDPNVVKVVTDREGNAVYFSRSPIPYVRDGHKTSRGDKKPSTHFKHLGMYIYERETLRQFGGWPTGFLEEMEKLEQLRALEIGCPIRVWETRHRSLRIDTQDDLTRAERELRGGASS